MHLIRTSAGMAALCDQPLDPELLELVGPYAAALEEFGEDLLADILIVEADDALSYVEVTYGQQLVGGGGGFAFTVELIAEHPSWFEVVTITSDSGDGVVLLVAKGGDAELMEACRSALTDNGRGGLIGT